MLCGKSYRIFCLFFCIFLGSWLVAPNAISGEMQESIGVEIERRPLRINVAQCWNVGNLNNEALNTVVVVEVKMNPDGTPIREAIRLVESFGGSRLSAEQLFESARRAIIRCGAAGFDLSTESYHNWKTILITFNPVNMRRR
jgi:hypothetical protein